MKLKEQEVASGKRWFALAGSVAVALTAALLYVDDRLTYSTAEIEKGAMLRELRTAASSLPAPRSVDERQKELTSTSDFLYSKAAPAKERDSESNKTLTTEAEA